MLLLLLRAGTLHATLRSCYKLAPSFDRGGTGNKGGDSGDSERGGFGVFVVGVGSTELTSSLQGVSAGMATEPDDSGI